MLNVIYSKHFWNNLHQYVKMLNAIYSKHYWNNLHQVLVLVQIIPEMLAVNGI
jgi:hypothetical protein